MKLQQAFEFEKDRQESNKRNIILLNKDGKFYHVYNWSAWLVKTIVYTEEYQKVRGDEKYLQAKRYQSKHGEYVMLGFPVDSLGKYIPNYIDANIIEGSEDICITIEVPMAIMDCSYDELNQSYELWKNNCKEEIKKIRNESQSSNAPMLGRSGLFQIVSQIMCYPLEKSTPTDNIEFLSKIKKELSALL